MMDDAKIIDAVSRFRPAEPLKYTGSDPILLALAKLPLQAGLATRVRTAIEAGATDEFVDQYVESWCNSAQSPDNENPHLHSDLDALRRGPPAKES
jgi:hypothetical protein